MKKLNRINASITINDGKLYKSKQRRIPNILLFMEFDTHQLLIEYQHLRGNKNDHIGKRNPKYCYNINNKDYMQRNKQRTA